jgi:hypothetical protein
MKKPFKMTPGRRASMRKAQMVHVQMVRIGREIYRKKHPLKSN